MKRLLFCLITTILLSIPALSNPIMPESLIAEVYFEEDEWFLLIDNDLLIIYGIEDFQNISICSKNGYFIFKDDFLPDFTQNTIVTNDALEVPVELDKVQDYLFSAYFNTITSEYIEFTELSWSDYPGEFVGGPNEGQSLIITAIYGWPYSYDIEWWLVKNNDPLLLGGGWDIYGQFQGYLFDENSNPVADAEISYISSYYQQIPGIKFQHLITNENGYFFHEQMYAKNWHITGVIKDSIVYPMDIYISIEPDEVLTMDLSVDLTTGIPNRDNTKLATIGNYPNPFNGKTTFTINYKGYPGFENGYINISDLSGRTISIVPLSRSNFTNNQCEMVWQSDKGSGMPAGNYLYSLIIDGSKVATGKMIINE